MTISSSTSKAQYTGNAATTIFAFNFLIPTLSDLQVYLDNALQSSGYTASGIGNPAGGSVTFTTAPGTGVIVSILRVVPLTQTVDYVPYDAFPAQTHEGALDKTAMIDQQLQEQIDRTLKLDVNVPAGNVIIETPVDEAILTWETSTPGVYRVKTGPSVASIQGNVDSAAASAASAAGSASSASAAASAAADSAAQAEEAANNLVANKYEETLTVAKSVFTIPFAISIDSPNVMIMVNGVVQSPSAFTLTNSTTITMSETLPIGTNFFIAAAAPPTLPDFTDIVRKTGTPTIGDGLLYNGNLWAPSNPHRKNFLINGGLAVAQRGTSFAASGYTVDRWKANHNASTISVVQFVATVAPFYGNNYVKMTLAAKGGTFTNFDLIQPMESKDSRALAGKTATFSVWLRRNSTFNAGNVRLSIWSGTGTDEPFVTTGRTDDYIDIPYSSLSDSSFQQFSVTAAIATSKTQVGVVVRLADGSIPDGSTLDVGMAQLELGSVTTPLEYRHYGEELALAQRYYEKIKVLEGSKIGMGQAYAVQLASGILPSFAAKRATPAISITGPFVVLNAVGSAATGTLDVSPTSDRTANWNLSGAANLNAGDAATLLANGASCEINIEAEL